MKLSSLFPPAELAKIKADLDVELARMRGKPDPRPSAPAGFFLFGPKG